KSNTCGRGRPRFEGLERGRPRPHYVDKASLFVICSLVEKQSHTGWRSRGYLPHYDAAEAYQHVVFRLHDSLPPAMETRADSPRLDSWFTEMEAALDAGRGERWLG